MRLTNIVARWPGSTHDSFDLTNQLEIYLCTHSVSRGKSDRAAQKPVCAALTGAGGCCSITLKKVCRIVQASRRAISEGNGPQSIQTPDQTMRSPNAQAIRTRPAVNSKNIKKVNGDNIHFFN
ncbi:hypothetical protein N1851_008275 [Merluccius polli]|uniref:Uncharacterized protein n=1 Tax=Merluccius polli TaxID=89951 RepID=A0AA47P4L0_MERPO|nr:hypothetical protein N1851_008275 [Merluccius polli]